MNIINTFLNQLTYTIIIIIVIVITIVTLVTNAGRAIGWKAKKKYRRIRVTIG